MTCGATQQHVCLTAGLAEVKFALCSNYNKSFKFWYRYNVSETVEDLETANQTADNSTWCIEALNNYANGFPSERGPEPPIKTTSSKHTDDDLVAVMAVIFVLLAVLVLCCYYRYDRHRAREQAFNPIQSNRSTPGNHGREEDLNEEELDDQDSLGLRSDEVIQGKEPVEVEMEMSALGKVMSAVHSGAHDGSPVYDSRPVVGLSPTSAETIDLNSPGKGGQGVEAKMEQ